MLRLESLFPSVSWEVYDQILLALKARFPGDPQSLCWIPGWQAWRGVQNLHNSGRSVLVLLVSSLGITHLASMGFDFIMIVPLLPSHCSVFVFGCGSLRRLCLWTWGVFFGGFQWWFYSSLKFCYSHRRWVHVLLLCHLEPKALFNVSIVDWKIAPSPLKKDSHVLILKTWECYLIWQIKSFTDISSGLGVESLSWIITMPWMPSGIHQLHGCEFEWTLRVGDGQGGLACCNRWCHKESDTTERLNWTECLHMYPFKRELEEVLPQNTQEMARRERLKDTSLEDRSDVVRMEEVVLEAHRSRKKLTVDSPRPSQGSTACWHLGMGPAMLILDFQPSDELCVVLSLPSLC